MADPRNGYCDGYLTGYLLTRSVAAVAAPRDHIAIERARGSGALRRLVRCAIDTITALAPFGSDPARKVSRKISPASLVLNAPSRMEAPVCDRRPTRHTGHRSVNAATNAPTAWQRLAPASSATAVP